MSSRDSPSSSRSARTGHLTIAEQLLGLPVDDPAITAYTAVIQIGAIVATFIYFAGKIARLFMAWVRGLTSAEAREDKDYTLAWAVIVGSIPVGIVGFLARDFIETTLRSLWVVAFALILWSAVIWVAEQRHDVLEKRGIQRGEHDITRHRRPGHRPRAGLRAHPGRLPLRRHDLGRPDARHQPRHGHRAVLLHGDPGPHRRGALRGRQGQGRPLRARRGPDARRHRRRLRHGLRLDRLAAALRRQQLAAPVHLVPHRLGLLVIVGLLAGWITAT